MKRREVARLFMFHLDYSYLNASTGSKFAARATLSFPPEY